LHIFSPKIVLGKAQKIWDFDYLIEHTSDHVTKFRGDRLAQLGDLQARIKKKKRQQKIRLPVTNVRAA